MATELLTADRICKQINSLRESAALVLTNYFVLHYRRYTAEGKAVNMTAALGVVLDTQTCQQSFYGGLPTEMIPKQEAGQEQECHRDDILALDLSADRTTVVTGEVGTSPAVHVWKADSREKVCQFNL